MTQPVAVVAGGSRGLGLLIARELLACGYRVSVCARDGDELQRARDWLAAPGRVHTQVCDVTDRAAVAAWLEDVDAELGPVEVAITVAGVIQVGPGQDLTLDHFDTAIDIMLRGPIIVARLVEPGMRERRKGRIGTVTSIGGVVSTTSAALRRREVRDRRVLRRSGRLAGRFRGDRHHDRSGSDAHRLAGPGFLHR